MGHSRCCVSLKVIFCLVIIASLVAVGFGQVLCTNPLTIGELRVKQSKKCVDISGGTGQGEVQAGTCDGGDDQQIILCGDGTIRNEKANFCFEEESNGNVKSKTCSLMNGIPAKQRWRKGTSKTFTDYGGISQTATQIINEGSQKCLDVSGSSGEGNILVYNCQNYDDQYFYFRSRGSELKFGRLQNEESDLCLDVTGSNGQGDVGMYNCQDQEDQWFRFYENGEIVNEKSRYCLDVSGSGSGNVLTYSCQDATDQMWSMPTTYCNGDYCSFVNQQSSKCLDVSGVDGTGNVLEYECQAISDQRFKWIADKWETPTATWNNVGCNQNGNVQRTVSSSLTTSASITSTLTLEVTSTIGANTKFASASVSTKIAASLAVAFSTSRTWTESVTYECEKLRQRRRLHRRMHVATSS